MSLDNLPAKIQSNPGTPGSALIVKGLLLHAKEFIEDTFAKRGRDTRSVIRYGNLQRRPTFASGILHGRTDRNRTVSRRVLERIAQQVGEHHRQPCLVSPQKSAFPVT